ncbi:MAG: hypothetical protein HC770_00600 [Pseudanabaena sp. CRU_2_10]|nr:hypothetical protein [Pseudanabaena sp. CRU_2_10]
MSVIALREDRLSGVNAGADLDGKDEVDAERQSPSVQKYTRIGPAVGSAARRNSEVDLARQLKAEANAALKYRTCSWQKVRSASI